MASRGQKYGEKSLGKGGFKKKKEIMGEFLTNLPFIRAFMEGKGTIEEKKRLTCRTVTGGVCKSIL